MIITKFICYSFFVCMCFYTFWECSIFNKSLINLLEVGSVLTGFAVASPFLDLGKFTQNNSSPADVVAWGRPAFSFKCSSAGYSLWRENVIYKYDGTIHACKYTGQSWLIYLQNTPRKEKTTFLGVKCRMML